MWTRILQWIMNQTPTKKYQAEGKDLFYRSYLFSFGGWVFYLHKYLRSDPDRGPHSHPFDAYALVLAGGYWEERLVSIDENGMVMKSRRLNPGAINKIDRYCFHRLLLPPIHKQDNEYIQPQSWSLFMCKYIKGKTWGFLRHYPTLSDTEDTYSFIYRRATDAERTRDRYWWKSAPKGKFVVKQ